MSVCVREREGESERVLPRFLRLVSFVAVLRHTRVLVKGVAGE